MDTDNTVEPSPLTLSVPFAYVVAVACVGLTVAAENLCLR